MYGEGLLKGLRITLKNFFGKKLTQEYPEVKPDLPPRSHCFFELIEENCIACGLCANACPNNVITVNSVRGEDKKKYLTEYKMDLSYCLFCGLCVDACPKDALVFTQDFELSCFNRDGAVYDLKNNKTEEESEVDSKMSEG